MSSRDLAGFGNPAPERLSALRRVTRLLSYIAIKKLDTRDAQEVAGYAKVMETIFTHAQVIPLRENHIKQPHRSTHRT